MIVGTAGHIDHGKSALVAALTGRSMDRLAEERRRGITIDLNFAPLELGDGRVAGVVDVPGHEDFVRTMVAGASGVDLALLVVAADEGIMPQTEEHLAILEQLAVPAGLAVITKADLVDADWLALVRDDLRTRLARSSVVFGQPLTVSARTGHGLDELRTRIIAQLTTLPPRPDDAFRMPIDRAFSVPGVGTVVTGTAWSGSIAPGAMVRILPAGGAGRVRTVELHGRPVPRSEAGTRTALGIAGLERSAVRRGDVAVDEALPWTPTTAVDVELVLEAAAPRPLVPRTRVRLHLGTAEVMARVHPRERIEPGSRGLARLALEAPVVARGGDRFVIRSYSPVVTIGGGRVLDPLPPRRAVWAAGLAAADPAERARALIARRRAGMGHAVAPLALGLPAEATGRLLVGDGALRSVGGRWVEAQRVSAVEARLRDALDAYHAGAPSEPGMPLETLRRTVSDPDLADIALDGLRQSGEVLVDNGVARRPEFQPGISGGDAALERIVALVEEAALTPPTVAELEALTGRRDVAAALRLAATAGTVEAVERDRYYASAALDRFVATLREVGAQGEITPPALRERLGLTRKYLIPLLEWADHRGITRRVGDARQLA